MAYVGGSDPKGPWTESRFGRAKMDDLRVGRRVSVRGWIVMLAVVAAALAWYGVKSLVAPDWGPLLVDSREPVGLGPATATGTLRITDDCTYIEPDGDVIAPDGAVIRNGKFVVAWPESRVRWDADTQQIRYKVHRGTDLALSDGDWISLLDGYYWGPTQVKEVAGMPVPDGCPDSTPLIFRGVLTEVEGG